MRVIALLAVRNEERYIGACLDHLQRHGIESYVMDHMSTDATASIVRSHPGVIGSELFICDEGAPWLPAQLRRKEELATELDADWFIHMDADEIRLPPHQSQTLSEALADVDRAGFNAVNFFEFTFIPTHESPDHDHPRFQQTMRFYYPFLPWFPQRLNAWKRQQDRVDLATDAGHMVRFPGLTMAPWNFPMRHYLFLSQPHALEKYTTRAYDPAKVAIGWSGWRVGLRPELIELPSEIELRPYRADDALDPSDPWTEHYLAKVRRRAEQSGEASDG